ncbi:hypothetical protein Dsin_008242 [Dipteronia sinensis]|uniref:DUF7796 domain-containing protein n=1 Tax=Dipteronia sinensis TaxID=43782 RepID=A0AAE0APJ1_9ROSI|nr:hypothetical protein Dsin_008242 [Dipteronia sinensis]
MSNITKWFLDLDWCLLFLIIPHLLFLSYVPPTNPLFSFGPLQSLFFKCTLTTASASAPTAATNSSKFANHNPGEIRNRSGSNPLDRSRIAMCLVGGAMRFELKGPFIAKNILEVYPNADLLLHNPVDSNAYKF